MMMMNVARASFQLAFVLCLATTSVGQALVDYSTLPHNRSLSRANQLSAVASAKQQQQPACPCRRQRRHLLAAAQTSNSRLQPAGPEVGANDPHAPKQKTANLSVEQHMFTSELLEDTEKLLYRPEELHRKITVSQFGLLALTAKFQLSIYNNVLFHRYDYVDELKVAGGPKIDHELCLWQLQHLVERTQQYQREKYNSKDLNLFALMDTYGQTPAGRFSGNTYWSGLYTQCLRSKIDIPGQSPVATRYCVASLAHPDWRSDTLFGEVMVFRSAVCLPKSCDSQRYKNKYQLVSWLLRFHAHEVDKGQYNMTSLYCLPDKESVLRVWYLSTAATVTVIATICWLSLLVCATIKYERLRRKSPATVSRQALEVDAKLDSTCSPELGPKDSILGRFGDRGSNSARSIEIYRCLSIISNLETLFDSGSTSSPAKTTDDELREKGSTVNDHMELKLNKIRNQSFVDLRSLEGIKVISMLYVVLGHVLLGMTSIVANIAEYSHSLRPPYYFANLVPAFAVNTFFTVTGLLTSYLLFKQRRGQSFTTSPAKWVAFIIYRYLRIMPMYALIVLYAKTISKYTGSGPMWDYATSSFSPRRTCEEESWLWTLLFGANFKTPLQHCVPTGWYLANDFQFFMVTPFFLVLLHKRPRIGKLVLLLSIAAGYIAGFFSILLSDAGDLRPVAQFMPHGFTTYVAFLNNNYTQPQYRIPAYLCGLLVGYALYNFEQAKISYLIEKAKQNDGQVSSNGTNAFVQVPNWPRALSEYGPSLSALLLILPLSAPLVGSAIPFSKFAAKLMVAFIMPTYHIFFALVIILYIIPTATGHANGYLKRFLSASFWKPLAKLSLCVVLINIEVINYLMQSDEQPRYIDDRYHIGLNLLCISCIYLLAIVIYILFEAPIRASLQYFLSSVVNKKVSK